VRNAAFTPLAAAAREQVGVGRAGVHTKTRSALAVGQLVDVGNRLDAQHLGPSRLVANTVPS
jgi:hypothetical protein